MAQEVFNGAARAAMSSVITTEQGSVNPHDARSATYTQFSNVAVSDDVLRGDAYVRFFNPEGASLTTEQKKQAREYARSGAIHVTLPVRNEMGVEALPSILSYFERMLGDSTRLIVIDADSTDGSFEEAYNRGFPVLKQSLIEEAYDVERLTHDFDVQWPLPLGKGRTLTASGVFKHYLRYRFDDPRRSRPKPQWEQHSDADITNIWQFDPTTFFSWYALDTLSSDEAFVGLWAAQFDRNNQAVMHAITNIQTANLQGNRYFKPVGELKWPLTGQFMASPEFVTRIPNVTGYGAEVIRDFAAVDYAEQHNMSLGQIEIPERCRDGQNSIEKEEAMMSGITIAVNVINEFVLARGIRILNDMSPEVIREVNQELRRRELGPDGLPLLVSVIPNGPGPNKKVPIRLDQILPSGAYLVEQGYVDQTRMQRIAQEFFGRVWQGVDLPDTGPLDKTVFTKADLNGNNA